MIQAAFVTEGFLVPFAGQVHKSIETILNQMVALEEIVPFPPKFALAII
jgi:hypothetical protein